MVTKVPKLSRTCLAGASLLALVFTVSCSGSQPRFSDLEQESQAADELPQLIVEAAKQLDTESSRFVGDDDGVQLWVAHQGNPETICIVVYPNEDDWVVACGLGNVVAHSPMGVCGAFPDGMQPPRGGQQISENVYRITAELS